MPGESAASPGQVVRVPERELYQEFPLQKHAVCHTALDFRVVQLLGRADALRTMVRRGFQLILPDGAYDGNGILRHRRPVSIPKALRPRPTGRNPRPERRNLDSEMGQIILPPTLLHNLEWNILFLPDHAGRKS